MDTGVIVSIVSGGFALACALAALVQTLRSSRVTAESAALVQQLQAQHAEALEALRQKNDWRKLSFQYAIDESGPISAALDDAWSTLQEIKACISRLLPRRTAGTDWHHVAADLTAAAAHLHGQYKLWGGKLDPVAPVAKTAWHESNNLVAELEAAYLGTPSLQFPPSFLQLDVDARMDAVRRRLSDYQVLLAYSRQQMLGKIFERVLTMAGK